MGRRAKEWWWVASEGDPADSDYCTINISFLGELIEMGMSTLWMGAFVIMERRQTAGERAREEHNTMESGTDQLKKRDLP